MGRARGQSHAGKTRRRNQPMSAQARAFVNGTASAATLETGPVALGAEHVLGGKGTGAHGKDGRARSKARRSKAKADLRRGDY